MLPTCRDSEIDHILEDLTWKIRVAADRQLVSAYQNGSRKESHIRRQLRRWEALGLIERESVAVALIEVSGPLIEWSPGMPDPDSAAVAWQLEQRWAKASPSRLTVNWASAKSANLYGGISGRSRQPLQIQHDLGTAAVYYRRLESEPEAAAAWIGEDIYRRDFHIPQQAKVPDAVHLDEGGRVALAVEFGGVYPAARIKAFHQYCSQTNLPYQLW